MTMDDIMVFVQHMVRRDIEEVNQLSQMLKEEYGIEPAHQIADLTFINQNRRGKGKITDNMKRLIIKTDGDGNDILVPNPDFYDENGRFKKVRNNEEIKAKSLSNRVAKRRKKNKMNKRNKK